MRKFYSLILMGLMGFFGSLQAQHQWTIISDNVGEIEAGEDHYYVIQEGDNTKTDGGSDGHSKAGYISNNAGAIPELKHECVFNFIDTGEKKEGFTIYLLKNVANGKYLVSNNNYTSIPAKAVHFTARKAEFRDESNLPSDAPWIEYSNAVSSTRSIYAEDAWVLCCCTNDRRYFSFWGSYEPNMAGYIDTNNWFIYEVEEDKLSAFDKFLVVYSEYFTSPVTEDIYPVGKNPGCVSREFFDRLSSLRDEALLLTENQNAKPEYCDSISNAIVNIFENELPKNIIPVTEGYYLIQNVRGGFCLDNGGSTLGDQYSEEKLTYPVESWNMDNAKYIWKFEKAEGKGRFYFRNFGSGQYVGGPSDYAMVDEPNTSFAFPSVRANIFLIHDGSSQVNVMTNGHWVNYNDANDPGNHFKFYCVDQKVVDSLKNQVVQNAENEKLDALIKQAELQHMIYRYKNGFVEEHVYNHPMDSGLVTKFMQANSWSTVEGSMSAPFDGNINTYFHTSWSDAEVAEQKTAEGDNHWVKVDLGREVQHLIVKFTKRQGALNGHISQYALYTPENGDPASADWNQMVVTSEDSISFQYGNNNTHIAHYTLDKPVRYLRFVVLQTRGADPAKYNSMTAGTGPLWHVSEFRMYDEDDCVGNPKYESIPENIRTAFDTALAKAKAEVADGKATVATYEELQTALENIVEAYPSTDGLKSSLKSASQMIEKAIESEDNELGFFKVGAKSALQQAIDAVSAELEKSEKAGTILTYEQIDNLQKQLDEAIDDFNSKLICPEDGKVYRMVCRTGFTAEGSEKPQNGACVASVDADYVNGTPVFRYREEAGVTERFNTLWLVEKGERGYAFKNLANGLYMNNAYDGLTKDEIKKLKRPNNYIGYSQTPKYFSLESFAGEGAAKEGCFIVGLTKNKYMNFQQNGQVMVEYFDRNDTNAALSFEEVTDDNEQFNSTYFCDIEAGKVQIKTLPITISEVYESNGGVYEVLGLKDNKIRLKAISGEIPAGTPFIINAIEQEYYIETELPNESLSDNLNLEYVYKPVVKNGLVSAPVGFTTKEGDSYGLLFNELVVASEAGDRVASGSGFFNNTIPATDEEGDFFLEIQGEITGEGTAVENVEVVKNVPMDVYTASGVKVRNNVKAGNATKNLPKGVYVVGGKKVIVK